MTLDIKFDKFLSTLSDQLINHFRLRSIGVVLEGWEKNANELFKTQTLQYDLRVNSFRSHVNSEKPIGNLKERIQLYALQGPKNNPTRIGDDRFLSL